MHADGQKKILEYHHEGIVGDTFFKIIQYLKRDIYES